MTKRQQQKDRQFKKAISSCKDLCASLYSLEEHSNIGTYSERIMAEHVLENVNVLYRLWKSTLETT